MNTHPPMATGIATTGRQQQAAVEAERQLLAALLDLLDREPATAREIAASVDRASVSHTKYGQLTLRGVLAAVEKAEPAVVDVLDFIRTTIGNSQQYVDARTFVTELVEDKLHTGRPAARVAEDRAHELARLHARRRWQDAVMDAGSVGSNASIDDMAAVEERLREAREAMEAVGGRDKNSPTTPLIDVLDRWAKHQREPVVPTLFSPIDRRLGGLPVGLTGIGARPGVGKSALACQITLGALLYDQTLRAAWFRGEMTNDLLASKMLAVWSGIRNDDTLYCGFKDAIERRPHARAVARDMALTISDRLTIVDPPLTPDTIERHITDLKPRLAVIDYLQLCEAPGQPDSRSQVEQNVRRLATLSTRFDIAIVVVSAFAGSKTKESGIGALAKETNLLDYSVHTFLSLWPEGDEDASPREITLKIEKSRTAAVGSETLWFDGRGQIFRPAADEYHELEAQAAPCPALAQFAPEALS